MSIPTTQKVLVYKRLVGRRHFYLKDDLIQEAVIVLIQKREQFNTDKAAYETWAKRIATNYMIDILRKNKNHLRNPSIFETVDCGLCYEDILADEQPTPCGYICDREQYHKIAKTIAPLFAYSKDRDRRIIAMHLKHYTQNEIACALGVTQPCVSRVVEKFRTAAAVLLGVNRREYKKWVFGGVLQNRLPDRAVKI